MCDGQKKIFLWSPPRCMSNAFLRAMSNHPQIKTIDEPYLPAYFLGQERVSSLLKDSPVEEHCTFMDKRNAIENAYPDAKIVFVKDLAYYLSGRLDSPTYMPGQFTFTFLMKHPRKAGASHHKLALKSPTSEVCRFDKAAMGFKELYEAFQVVTEQLGQEAIIIDADELLKDPEAMMRLYCSKVGIEFDDKLLNWAHPPDSSIFWGDIFVDWRDSVNSKSGFDASISKPVSDEALRDLPQVVQDAIDECMPYYNKLYSLRLQPNLQR